MAGKGHRLPTHGKVGGGVRKLKHPLLEITQRLRWLDFINDADSRVIEVQRDRVLIVDEQGRL